MSNTWIANNRSELLRCCRIGAAAVAFALGFLGPSAPRAAAEPGLQEFSEGVAETFAQLTTRRWVGPRVPFPDTRPRPTGEALLTLPFAGVTVHGPASLDPSVAEEAARALRDAIPLLRIAGWEPKVADGALGGDPLFDLYLADGAPTAGHADPGFMFTTLDTASTFATVDATLPEGSLGPCAVQAYVEARLLAQNPAEHRTLRRATAALLTQRLTGRWGCADRIEEAQADPERGLLFRPESEDEDLALFLSFLSDTHDRGSTAFIRGIWQFARQDTWEGDDLRASPDFFEALSVALENSGLHLAFTARAIAIQRFSTGERRGRSQSHTAQALPGAAPPIRREIAWSSLPRRLRPEPRGIGVFGSSYTRIDVSDAPARSRLRIWLESEWGAGWALSAVSFDADGHERGRVYAGPSERADMSFLPVEIDEGVAEVIIVVANVGYDRPDPDVDPGEYPDPHFRLILGGQTDEAVSAIRGE